jgi:transcriptional regulator with XRE-family HTH domain
MIDARRLSTHRSDALTRGRASVPTLYIRTLKRAAELIGGEEELARRLKVAPNHLTLWIRGVVAPPGDIFLKAAEIVSEDELKQLAAKHASTAPPKSV